MSPRLCFLPSSLWRIPSETEFMLVHCGNRPYTNSHNHNRSPCACAKWFLVVMDSFDISYNNVDAN